MSRAIALPVPPANRRPVAYLRRSKADSTLDKDGNPTRPGAVSHATQVAKIKALAGADAERLVWIEDWGVSGQKKSQHRRKAYAELRAMIDRGEVSDIYAWSLNRLSRNLSELNDLAHECGSHGIPIHCADGYSPDPSNATGTMILNMLGAVAQYMAEWQSESAINTNAIRRERGDTLGAPRYGTQEGEDVSVLVTAFREAGSFRGAVMRLNAAGVPAPQKGNPWSITTLARILRRPDVDAAPPSRGQGVRGGPSTRLLSGLLLCACGSPTPLTSMPSRHSIRYYCRAASMLPSHPRPVTVTESMLVEWVKAEVTRGLGSHRIEIRDAGRKNAHQRERLELQRQRLVDDYFAMTGEKPTARLAEIDAQLAALGPVDRSIAAIALTPVINWAAEPGVINGHLRKLWSAIVLGPNMRPVKALWYLTQADREAAEDAQTATIRANW
jgi:DNA invertase Pin-like site-specific DNA recombinase